MIVASEMRSRGRPGGYWTTGLVGAGLIAASVLGFKFPIPVLVSVLAVIGLVAAVRFPSYVLFLYAGTSILLLEVPLASGSKISASSAAGALFMVATVLHVLVTGSLGRLHSLLPRALLLLATVVALNALVKAEWIISHPHGTIALWALCASAFCVPQVVRDPGSAWKLGTVLVLGATAISLVALYESATGQYNLFGVFSSYDNGRAYGVADPNYTAALLVTLFPLLVAQFVCAGSPRAGALAVLGIVLSLVAIAMTASRGGIVGLVVTVLAVLLWVFPKRATKSSGHESPRIRAWIPRRIVLVSVLAVCFGVAVCFAPSVFWVRLSTLQDWSHPEEVKESRVELWSDYVEKWRESPWWGYGPGYLESYAVGQSKQVPHNTPVEALVEVGLIGFAPFLLLNGVAFAEALKARKRFAQSGEPKLCTLSGAVAASLIGFHSTAFFLSAFSHKELWLLLGFSAALHSLSWRQNASLTGSP
jgi:O-antigen ligase